MSTIGSQSLEVYRHCVDLDDTMDAFLMDLSSLVSISKLLLTRLNYRHTRSLLSSIVEDLSILEDSNQREIVMRYTTRGRIVSAAILYLGYASGMSFVFRTLPLHYVLPQKIDRNETYDVKVTSYFLSTYCVFDDQSGFWRAAILLLQTIQIFVNATSHCGNDGFFFGIAMHLCGQFEVLRMNFANLGSEENLSCKKIDALVRRHCHLIRLADNLEEAFNMIILIQLLMSALLLCIEGFQMLVSLDANDIIATTKHAVLIVTLLVQIFIYSYAGDMLESKSADLILGVYDSPWYTFDTSVVKNLAFVIFYGKIPRQVTAGKFVSMNFFTFKEIIKASASYISVLRVALYFGILVSILMEIRLNCGTVDETLDFFGLSASSVISLTKLILMKLHQKDLRRIVQSALKDWSTFVDGSSAKDIMLKYTNRGKLVCRIQMGLGLVIITTMILDALPASESSLSDNSTSKEEIVKRTPLKMMCLFGNMSTSTYWTVFVLQGVQLLDAVFVDCGHDVFFFGIAMHICSQFDALKIFCDELNVEDEENRIEKIKEFIERHSHVLDLAHRLGNTFNYILLVILMGNGIHICSAGIQMVVLSKQNDIVSLLKAILLFNILLGQLFLYSYAGDYLSSLSNNVCHLIYNCPWYEFSPSIVRNLKFIIMRTQIPFRLKAGRFYAMDIENFKNILKAFFSLLLFRDIISKTLYRVLESLSAKMDMEDVVWNTDATYALGTYKFITWTTGTWPLQDEGIFAMIRFTIAFILEFSLLASVLLEIRLNCGNTDKTLEFFGLTAGMTTGLTKLIFVKLHQEDLRKILLSAIKDWSSIAKDSSAKEIIWKYTHRGKMVCRVQMSLGLLIIASMIMDAVPTSDFSQQDNITSSEENLRQIPLRTTCLFGNMSTSTYWTVFVLQGVQLLNSIAVNMGNDVFFFAIAMHICGQLDALRIFCDDFKANDEKDRVLKIEKFVRRHSHLLELAQRLENTFANILLVNLMTDGLHTCLAGVQILAISNKIDIVPLTKVSSVIVIILAQLFLYSYAGDYLSSLFQDICQVIYNCPWYEFSPNNVRNLMFIIMRTHVPFHLTAGRFYTMDIENFKNIVKTSFSFFSLLRIVFSE
nr:uncharacterized protein LOC127070880 [Vespula vulgaris]